MVINHSRIKLVIDLFKISAGIAIEVAGLGKENSSSKEST